MIITLSILRNGDAGTLLVGDLLSSNPHTISHRDNDRFAIEGVEV